MAKKKKVWEPEFRSQFVSGTFVDYCGNVRDYNMCAVSIPTRSIAVTQFGDFITEKALSIGVSVRSVRDADNGMGPRIAYGKAVNPRSMEHVMFVTHPGMINTLMVEALLKQEAAHFEKDPGTYLAGYNHDKMKYEKTGVAGTAETVEAPKTVSSTTSVSLPATVATFNPSITEKK